MSALKGGAEPTSPCAYHVDPGSARAADGTHARRALARARRCREEHDDGARREHAAREEGDRRDGGLAVRVTPACGAVVIARGRPGWAVRLRVVVRRARAQPEVRADTEADEACTS